MDELSEKIQKVYQETVLEGKKNLSVPEKHQLKIAKKTLKMSDAGANVMGGMTKQEARDFLKKIGYSDKQIKKMEESEERRPDGELNEASEVEFTDFDKSKQKFISDLVGKANVNKQTYFSGIHGTIASLQGQMGAGSFRVSAKELKKIANNKDVRWVEISNIAMGYNKEDK